MKAKPGVANMYNSRFGFRCAIVGPKIHFSLFSLFYFSFFSFVRQFSDSTTPPPVQSEIFSVLLLDHCTCSIDFLTKSSWTKWSMDQKSANLQLFFGHVGQLVFLIPKEKDCVFGCPFRLCSPFVCYIRIIVVLQPALTTSTIMNNQTTKTN